MISLDSQDCTKECSVGRVLFHNANVVVHQIPFATPPRRGGSQCRHASSVLIGSIVPVLLRNLREHPPFTQGMQTSHLTHHDIEIIRFGLFTTLICCKCLLPSLKFLKPSFLQLNIAIKLCSSKDAN